MNRQRGFNLIEVLIAMALLGVVLVSIVGLFYSGRRNVYSGKQMTQAVASGTRVMETVAPMDKSALIAAFGLPTGAGTANTVGGVSYANSFLRSTDDTSTDPKGYLTLWKNELLDNNKFAKGSITVVFTPTADPTNTPAQLGTATVVRVRTIVSWVEGRRNRTVTLDAVKVQR